MIHKPPARVLDVDGHPLEIPPGSKAFDVLTSIDPQPRLTL